MRTKEEMIFDIMDLLEGSYTPESGVYVNVRNAFNKLSKDDLGSLYAMLLCEIKIKS